MNSYTISGDDPKNVVVDLWRLASHHRASDIHLSQHEKEYVRISLRIDGIIRHIGKMSPKTYNCFLKDLEKDRKGDSLVIDAERRVDFETRSIPLRIAVIPAIGGPEAAIRILDPLTKKQSLEDIGFSKSAIRTIEKKLTKRQGAVIITGATGSGKTTTYYALLEVIQALSENPVRILSVEDMIEKNLRDGLDDATQIVVDNKKKFPLPAAINAGLRLMPDVLAVSEIREKQAAGIFLDAVSTGIFGITTFHSNSCIGALRRLETLGQDIGKVADNVCLVISQRLERKLCDKCKIPCYKENQEHEKLAHELDTDLGTVNYHRLNADGCDECLGSGYKGRVMVYSMFDIHPDSAYKVSALIKEGKAHSLENPDTPGRFTPEKTSRDRLVRNGILPYKV